MEENIKGEVKAFCYLYKDGDEKNKALLTDEKFYVIHHRRIFEFQAENIKRLSVNLRKLMLPLIVGGIVSSFSLIAIFKDVFNPYLVLMTLMAGLLALYVGWMGQWNFTVETNIKEYDFSIPSVTDNLKTFITFLNRFKVEAAVIFLVFPRSFWEKMMGEQGRIALPETPLKGYTADQAGRLKKRMKESVLVQIDPFKAEAEIKFMKDERSYELHPFIMSDFNPEAIIQTEIVK